jgi:YVTN family beta-propeller protein
MLRSFRAAPVILALAFASPLLAQGGLSVKKKFTVGGDGGWDYVTVDGATHRLYVPRSTHTLVIDTETGSIVADIPNTKGVHGVALAPELNRGFTSNGADTSVTIFDLKSNAVIGMVRGTGLNPDAILYEPTTKRVFTFNGRSNDATVIDAALGKVLGTVKLGGKPEFSQTDGGIVYVNIENKEGSITAIDAKTMQVKADWKMADCEEPSGLAIDHRFKRLFAVCGNKQMKVVDFTSGRLVASVATGDGTDGVAFDEGTQLAVASNGADGTATVVHQDGADKYTLVGNVPTQRSARTIGVDPKSHRFYLPAASFDPAPAPAAGTPRPRPKMTAGSFTILVLDR